MNSTRRHFIKNVVVGLGALALACETDPVSTKKVVIVQSVVTGSNSTTGVKPVGETATIKFSGSVSNVSTDTVYIEDTGGTVITGHEVKIDSETQCTVTFPTLTPASEYRLVVDGVTTVEGDLIDGDNDGRSGGKYKINITVVPATSVTHVYNLVDNVIENVYIHLQVSNALDVSTITLANVRLVEKANNSNVTISVVYDETKKEIQLYAASLAYGKEYQIKISENVKDEWGFSLDGDNDNLPGGEFVYEFITTANPDNDPPILTDLNPIDGSLGVDINTTIFAVFNEKLNSTGIAEKIFLTDSTGTRVQGGVSYDSGLSTLQFIPESVLDPSTIYTVHLTGLQDLAGNDFNDGQEYTWSFTTEVDAGSQIPDAVSELNAVTGTNPGEVILSWTVPADKTSDGKSAVGTELRFDIFRDLEPISNEGSITKAELIEADYQPGVATGGLVQLVVDNPESAQTYYYAIRVIDVDDNESQFTSSPAVQSKGYPMQLKLVDGVLYERNGASANLQVWDGVKILQNSRQIGMSDENGLAQFEAASDTGSITIGDENSAIVPVFLPYTLQSGEMNSAFVVPLYDKETILLEELIKVMNPNVQDPVGESSFAYLMKWANSVTQAGNGQERIVPLSILGMASENQQTTSDLIDNVNTWIALATRNKLRVQTLTEATQIDRTITVEEDETGYEYLFLNNDAETGLLWTQSKAAFNRPDSAETDGNPHTSAGPHEVSKGLVVTQDTLDSKRVFTQFWRALMNMFGQLDESQWDQTVLNDEYDTSEFMNKITYRGISNQYYLEEIVASVYELPVGAKVSKSIINLPLQLFS